MILVRSLIFTTLAYITMILAAVLCSPALLVSRRLCVEAVRLWVRITRFNLRYITGIKTEFRGLEHLPDGPFIWASKHQSMYDALAPWLVLDHPAIIIKKELLWYPFFGWYAWRTDMISIDRSGGAKTLKNMIAASAKSMKGNRQLMIFPEGTRQKPGAKPFYRPGIFGLYHALDLPVVPVATNNGLCWPARGIRRTPGTIVIEVLPPIETGLEKNAFMKRLETDIETASEALLEEGLAEQGRTRADIGLATPS